MERDRCHIRTRHSRGEPHLYVRQVLAYICDAKIPPKTREGIPFEETLYSWLSLIFIPTYKRKMKEKTMGIGKKTL